MEVVLQKGYKPNQIKIFLQELTWREYYQRAWQHVDDDIRKDIKKPQPDVLHPPAFTYYPGVKDSRTCCFLK